MAGIHERCVEYGGRKGSKVIGYVRARTSPASRRWADAMLAYGVV
jgi:glutamate dehydrogenase (NADP+)